MPSTPPLNPPPSYPLIGPSVIRQLPSSSSPWSTTNADAQNPGSAFVAVLDAVFNPTTKKNPQKGFTENRSPTFLTSGNPCLDLFFQVVPDTPSATVVGLLYSAWAHDPLTTLKLVCNLRGVRGTGKIDREGFYASALWIHENHPKTLALNAASFAEFGYMKDLLEILYRLVHGADVRKQEKAARERREFASRRKKGFRMTRRRTWKMPPKEKKKRRPDTIADRILFELKRLNLYSDEIEPEEKKEIEPEVAIQRKARKRMQRNQKRLQTKTLLAMRAVRLYVSDKN